MADSELVVVCEELDRVLEELLLLVASYRGQCASLGTTMKQGFFDLTQAKHVMGPSRVSKFQYDQRMHSILRLQIEEAESPKTCDHLTPRYQFEVVALESSVAQPMGGASSASLFRRGESGGSMQSLTQQPLSSSSSSSTAVAASDSQSDGGSTVGSCNETELSAQQDAASEAATDVAPKSDPLLWFGLLVPSHLRHSQSSFKRAVSDVAAIASFTFEIRRMQERYSNLLARKIALVAAGYSGPQIHTV